MKVTETKERIKELMRMYNLNQSEFCNRTKIKKSALSNYLNGSRVPRQEQISKIADSFNISPSWLLGYDVPMKDSKIPGPDDLPIEDVIHDYLINIASKYKSLATQSPKEQHIVSDKEYLIVEAYRQLDVEQQEMIQRMMHSFINTPKPPLKGQMSLFDLFGDNLDDVEDKKK